ncbi:unnamed protein product, partial [Laminaria digitata]
ESGSLTDVLDERHIVLVQPDRVTLPREREASVSSEQAATLRACDDADMELDSGSQTEGDEGGDGDGDGDGERVLLVVEERVRMPRGRTMRSSRDPVRGRVKDDASSTAVAVANGPARRTQSSPPALQRPPPPPPTARAVAADHSDTHTAAASGSEVGEQTLPTTQAAGTQTDMEEEEEAPELGEAEVADAHTETEEGLESPTTPQVAETQTEEDGET